MQNMICILLELQLLWGQKELDPSGSGGGGGGGRIPF